MFRFLADVVWYLSISRISLVYTTPYFIVPTDGLGLYSVPKCLVLHILKSTVLFFGQLCVNLWYTAEGIILTKLFRYKLTCDRYQLL